MGGFRILYRVKAKIKTMILMKQKQQKMEVLQMYNVKTMNELIITNFAPVEKVVLNENNYFYTRTNENVKRGDFDNLTAVSYRCFEENHNLCIYHINGKVEYVETGYSIN